MDAPFIDDPFFHQRYRFSRHGDTARIEIWTEPGGGVSSEHFHPRTEERFEVFEGEITFSVEGEKRVARAGDVVVAKPGVRHSFENTGATTAHLASEATPALELEESIERGAALLATGRFTKGGLPKGLGAMLDAVAFAHRYRETLVLTFPPPAVQRILYPPLARLARRRSAP